MHKIKFSTVLLYSKIAAVTTSASIHACQNPSGSKRVCFQVQYRADELGPHNNTVLLKRHPRRVH